MTNLELYKKIEAYVYAMPAYSWTGYMYDQRYYDNKERAQKEILHWMQLGEDALVILEEKAQERKRLAEEYEAKRKEVHNQGVDKITNCKHNFKWDKTWKEYQCTECTVTSKDGKTFTIPAKYE